MLAPGSTLDVPSLRGRGRGRGRGSVL